MQYIWHVIFLTCISLLELCNKTPQTGLNNRNFLSLFWRPKVWDQDINRLAPFGVWEEEFVPCLSSSLQVVSWHLWHACMGNGFCRVWLCATLWTVAHQALLSMGFSRQEYWSGLLFPSPGDLPDPGIKPASLIPPELASGFFPTEPLGSSYQIWMWKCYLLGCILLFLVFFVF